MAREFKRKHLAECDARHKGGETQSAEDSATPLGSNKSDKGASSGDDSSTPLSKIKARGVAAPGPR